MTYLLTGIALFFGAHVLPAFSYRQRLIDRIGFNAYRGIYALVSLSGLILIVVGKIRSEVIDVWIPPYETRYLTMLLMPVALFFLAMPDFPNNFRRKIAHPMMTGILVWSGAHLVTNGDLASMLLFGSFFAYSIFSIVSVSRRKEFQPKDLVPWYWNIALITFVLLSYVLIFNFHVYVSGKVLV